MTAESPLLGYAPGTSWLHRSSPLPKLAWLLASFPVVLLTFDPTTLLGLVAVGVALATSAGVARMAARATITLSPVAAGIVVLQALAPVACARAGCTPVGSIGPVAVYGEGVGFALVLVARLVALELAATALLATTHPSDLFTALRRLRLPHEVALMAMVSVHLVPQVGASFREVLAAQRARGLRGSGVRALVPTLVPVVAGTFDRLTLLVLSLEARGVGGDGPRTSYRAVRLGTPGRLAIVGAIGAVAASAWLAAARAPVAPGSGLALPAPVAIALVLVAAVVFVGVVVAGVRGLVRS